MTTRHAEFQGRYHMPRRHYWARVTTIVAGLWLLLSAFAWPHNGPIFTNTWVVGLGSFFLGLWAFRDPFARWFSGALAIWLVVINLLSRDNSDGSTLTLWNNVVVCTVIFIASMIDGTRVQRKKAH